MSIPVSIVPSLQTKYYFVKRDFERDDFSGELTRPGMPCVFRTGELDNSQNGHFSAFTAAWQFFTFDLLSLAYYSRLHGVLTKSEYDYLAQKWTSVYGEGTAFTNNQ